MTTIKELQSEVHELARSKGWWPELDCGGQPSTNDILAKLALIHSEVSEAVEEARKGGLEAYYAVPDIKKPEGSVVELADAVIRIMDLCGALGLDLESAILEKHNYNKTRSYRHGGKLA